MKNLFVRLGILLVLVMLSQTASAALETSGVLNDVGTRFLNESSTWGGVVAQICSASCRLAA